MSLLKKKYHLCWQPGRSSTSNNNGDRRSAVEMLQATKGLYVKSDRVRGTDQQLFEPRATNAQLPGAPSGAGTVEARFTGAGQVQGSCTHQQIRVSGDTPSSQLLRARARPRTAEENGDSQPSWWRLKDMVNSSSGGSPVQRLCSSDIDDVQTQLRRLLTPSTVTTTPPSVADSRSNERTDECGCHKSLPNISSGFESGGDAGCGAVGESGYCDDIDDATDGDAVDGWMMDRGLRRLVRRRRRSRRRHHAVRDSKNREEVSHCYSGLNAVDQTVGAIAAGDAPKHCTSGTDESCSGGAGSAAVRFSSLAMNNHTKTATATAPIGPNCRCDLVCGFCQCNRPDLNGVSSSFHRNHVPQKPAVHRSKSDIDRRKHLYGSDQWMLGGSSDALLALNSSVCLPRRCSFDFPTSVSYGDVIPSKSGGYEKNLRRPSGVPFKTSTPLTKHLSFSYSQCKLTSARSNNHQPVQRRQLERFFENSSGCGLASQDRLGVSSTSGRFHVSVSGCESPTPCRDGSGASGGRHHINRVYSYSPVVNSSDFYPNQPHLMEESKPRLYNPVYPYRGRQTIACNAESESKPYPSRSAMTVPCAPDPSLTAVLTPRHLTLRALMPMSSEPSVVEKNARIVKWLVNCRRAQGLNHEGGSDGDGFDPAL